LIAAKGTPPPNRGGSSTQFLSAERLLARRGWNGATGRLRALGRRLLSLAQFRINIPRQAVDNSTTTKEQL